MTLFDWVHFTRPDWLLLIPILWFLSFLIHRKPTDDIIKSTVAPHLLPYLSNEKSVRGSLKWLGLICTSLLVVGLSGISFSKAETQLYSVNQKTVFIVDQSLSLYSTDVRPNRLTRAKQLLRDIINSPIEGDFALVAFAGDAYVVSPYTQDKNTLTHFLVALDPLIMPIYGSNLNDGLSQALTLVDTQDSRYTTFVVLTDDIQQADEALLKQITQQGIALEMISVGTSKGAPIILPDGQTLRPQGITAIPKAPLKQIEQATLAAGGHYYTHLSDLSDLEQIGQHAEQASHAHSTDIAGITWEEQGHWFALPFLIWLLWQFRSGYFFVLTIILLNTPTMTHASPLDWFKTDDQKAQQAVNEGDWEKAAQLFNEPHWKAASEYAKESYEEAAKTLKPIATSASDFYNLGNTLALHNDLPAAVEAYSQALERRPDFKEAQENLEYIKKLLKEQQSEQDSSGQKDGRPNSDSQDSKQSQESKSNTEDQDNPQQTQDNKSENQDNQSPDQEAEQGTPNIEDSASLEERQALEQWLRQIQDDPGTLLQRKLWYLHQERRNENRFNQEEGQQPW